MDAVAAGNSSANDFAYAVGSYARITLHGEARHGQYVPVWVRKGVEALTRWTMAAKIIAAQPPPNS